MKYNYPVRYAAIPMIEEVGYDGSYRRYDTVAYIAAKCYLISENKEYNSLGKQRIQYQIVFPYQFDDFYDTFKRVKIGYNLSCKCSNTISTSLIFDNFQEAVTEAKRKNEELLSSKHSYTDIIKHYKALETVIENKTQDLIVRETPKEQDIIIIGKNDARLGASLYYMIDNILWPNFYAYNVSSEEYKEMKTQLENSIIPSGSNQNCLIQKREDIIQIHNYNNSDEKGCFCLTKDYLHNDILYYDETIQPFTNDEDFNNKCISIYTLETYEDVIGSFACNLIDDEVTINGKTFAKRIKL